jgi:hypothetical protein
MLVTPSVALSGFEYRPCEVELSDGSVNSYVYVADSVSYFHQWGVDPEDDPGKSSILIEDISRIKESPYRLPPAIASEILRRHPGGMEKTGGFYLRLEGNRYLHCHTGDAVDFLNWPEGVTPDQVTGVLDSPAYGQRLEASGAEFWWALFEQS